MILSMPLQQLAQSMPPKKDLKKEVPPPVEEPKIEEPVIPEHQLRGFGRFQYQNGAIYEGHWQLHNGIKMKEGQGELTIPGYGLSRVGEEKYIGEWKLDLMEGYGTYKYASGAVFKGDWKLGQQDGRGVYEFPDGSIYDGEWKNHEMSGEGKLINSQGNVFEGIYVCGKFESKNQDQLRKEKENRIKEAKVNAEILDYFTRFSAAFAKSDKKTFKQNLLPFFATQEEAKLYVKDPYPKYEERAPDKWEEGFAHLRTQGAISILKTAAESTFLDPARILGPQFEGLGQVIEVKSTIGQRIIRLGLCKITPQLLVPVFYHDSSEGKK